MDEKNRICAKARAFAIAAHSAIGQKRNTLTSLTIFTASWWHKSAQFLTVTRKL